MSELWVGDFLKHPLGFRDIKEGYKANLHPSAKGFLPNIDRSNKWKLISRYTSFWPNPDNILLERLMTRYEEIYLETLEFYKDSSKIEATFKPEEPFFTLKIQSRDRELEGRIRDNLDKVSGRKALMYVYEAFHRHVSGDGPSIAYSKYNKQKLYK